MPSSLSCAKLSTWIAAAALLQMIGLSLFVLGFFPVKPALSGVSGPDSYRVPKCDSAEDRDEMPMIPPDQLRSSYREMSGISPFYDRLILVVIDGLPAEFVLGKNNEPPTMAMMEAMPYTQALLSNGKATGFHAKAAPPTVTMPRLKAMVSGAIGGFLDVAFNFDTQAFLDDNLLGQFNSIGWKMVMLGDETWIKLFPGLFMRQDGVSSFFVKDTIQVDYNVSRHLEAELQSDDWNVLILHYLGLDHVGHIGGRNSILMLPKLKEMDDVVMRIHQSISSPHDTHHRRTLLVIASDHGMTESGNHGGSSYEETDSLAIFIGLESKLPEYAPATCKTVSQVDLAPTLALLLGVPIPKNNAGILIAEIFDFLSDGELLRALELNSWQLLRLLQAQLPGLLCSNRAYSYLEYERSLRDNACKVSSVEDKFGCLFSKATALHDCWRSHEGRDVRSNRESVEFKETLVAYYDFLTDASEWLSWRATDKPFEFLVPGIIALLVSCCLFLSILFRLCREASLRRKHQHLDSLNPKMELYLDETFVIVFIFILVISMGSSSMVEEEQYIWHFMTSTLYFIFLRKSIQLLLTAEAQKLRNGNKGPWYSKYYQFCSIVVVLVCGRVLRGWHQGGVNWVHLPDISTWLEKVGPHFIQLIKLGSMLFVVSFGIFGHCRSKSKGIFVLLIRGSFFVSGLLLLYLMKYQDHTIASSGPSSTLIAQIVFLILGVTVIVGALKFSWTVPLSNDASSAEPLSMIYCSIHQHICDPFLGLRCSAYSIGWIFMTCWCILQLLLQRPTNAMPISLLLLQILASMLYFSLHGHHREWVEVAALYFLGLAGHFGLGNSNSIATIDVAGAFTGISSHSTFLSGILMFIITYASPLLCLLSMIMYASVKDEGALLSGWDVDLGVLLQSLIAFPCVVPLSLNSVLLTTCTIILLLMRNHLFIWSVFSPKYLYACAATVCVYIGVSVVAATGIYVCSIYFFRRKISSNQYTAAKNPN
ncbi:hypothetical protein Scep_020366 [Stephania cephalantha]|uniref:GPI ethanolamine phosphate transferase 2 C-terminal domain-containing protein n=1 Tax=Stephania cephalantha TaxID=152367 RepID=A0AAP0IDI4_9MAGN